MPKPEHALRLESIRTDNRPVWARLAHAAELSVLTRSLDAVSGLYKLLPSRAVGAIFSLDVLLTVLALGGAVTCLYQLVRRSRIPDPSTGGIGFCEILLIWLLFPAIAGALLLKQINPGYLSTSLPAGWLLILFLPEQKPQAQHASVLWITRAAAVLVLAAGSVATAYLLSWVLSSSGQIRAYEMPYALQKDAAAYILQRGIAPDRIRHLSGPVFGEPYRYIAWHLDSRDALRSEASNEFALITDLPWLEPYPERRTLLEQSGAARVGPVLILTQPSRGSMEIFTRRYLELN